jgi:hypothetical protein
MKNLTFRVASAAGMIVILAVLGFAFCPPGVGQTMTSIRSDGLNFATPGSPFQADGIARSSQLLADGTRIEHELHITMGRDMNGRIYYETRSIQPADDSLTHVILDPVAGRILSWGTRSKVVMSQALSAGKHVTVSSLPLQRDPTSRVPKDKTEVTTQTLGTKMIAGVVADGTRTTTTIPTGTIGNNEPILLHREVWISEALQLVLAESDDSPFGGNRSMDITKFAQGEPPADVFLPPADMQIRDVTPPLNAGVPLPPRHPNE